MKETLPVTTSTRFTVILTDLWMSFGTCLRLLALASRVVHADFGRCETCFDVTVLTVIVVAFFPNEVPTVNETGIECWLCARHGCGS